MEIKDMTTSTLLERKRQLELILKPEISDDFIRIPVDRGDHEGHRIRTIVISAKEGIKAIYCGTDKVVMTFLFLKGEPYNWTLERAKAWVKEHEGKSLGNLIATESDIVEQKTSQEEIIDEIDYLKTLIDKEGLSDKAKEPFRELMKRFPADDIAVKIETTTPITAYMDKTGAFGVEDILEAIKRIAKT